jgi:hypothetical protein
MARYAALDQRMIAVEDDVKALNVGMQTLRAEFSDGLRGLYQKLDARDDRRWIVAPAIASMMLVLAVVGGLGTLSLNPVKTDLDRLRTEVKSGQRDDKDDRRDLAERDRRIWVEVLKTRSDLDYLRGQLNPLARP